MTDATKVKEATPDMFIAGGIAIAKALEAQKDDPEATLVDVAVACWDAMRAALPSPAALDPVTVEACAKAIANRDEYDDWNGLTETTQDHYRGLAIAAIRALSHPAPTSAVSSTVRK